MDLENAVAIQRIFEHYERESHQAQISNNQALGRGEDWMQCRIDNISALISNIAAKFFKSHRFFSFHT